jgi:hypothetical protein
LVKQAQRLVARDSERKKQGNHVPREGYTPPAGGGDEREAVQAIFGSGQL